MQILYILLSADDIRTLTKHTVSFQQPVHQTFSLITPPVALLPMTHQQNVLLQTLQVEAPVAGVLWCLLEIVYLYIYIHIYIDETIETKG